MPTQAQFRAKGTDLGKLTASVAGQTEALATAQSERASLAAELARLEADPTAAELNVLVGEASSRVKGLSERAAALRALAASGASGADLTPAAKERQRKKLLEYRDAWLKRKRACTEALANLADAMELKPKDVSREVGIETDDDAGVQLPSLPAGCGRTPGKPIVRLIGKKR